MKQAPLTFKLIINFVAYIGYTLLLSIIFSFAFPFVLTLMWKEIFNPNDPIFVKIQITIAVVVFVFTLLFRKYFYLSFWNIEFEEEKVREVKLAKEENEIKKEDWLKFEEPVKVKEKEYKFNMDDLEEDEDDDLRIFVDKEIKR